eukprot:TRINITY_DN17640_c0_g1_i1.p2 TRINITY_DN17640_c0_g1~~TRINITY_DN17640_c0_g1_i1.p2  ORF type:complete len:207 (-),score=12.94 TRINITY_DN17640_c0_g1_i1:201-821(-)
MNGELNEKFEVMVEGRPEPIVFEAIGTVAAKQQQLIRDKASPFCHANEARTQFRVRASRFSVLRRVRLNARNAIDSRQTLYWASRTAPENTRATSPEPRARKNLVLPQRVLLTRLSINPIVRDPLQSGHQRQSALWQLRFVARPPKIPTWVAMASILAQPSSRGVLKLRAAIPFAMKSETCGGGSRRQNSNPDGGVRPFGPRCLCS